MTVSTCVLLAGVRLIFNEKTVCKKNNKCSRKDGNHIPKHVGVKNFERINKKIHYFLEHLLVFLQTALQDARFNHQYNEI
jgi:hypothetical protein